VTHLQRLRERLAAIDALAATRPGEDYKQDDLRISIKVPITPATQLAG
jgi:hypothetical protein